MTEECKKIISMKDTFTETVYHVLPMYSNPYGALHGGMALNWILSSATMSAMRASRRPAVVARLDHTFFINPVLVGENAIVYSWIDYMGRSSLEATVIMEGEDPSTGKRRLTTISYVVLVAVNEDLRPEPLGVCLRPSSELEKMLYESAVERRKLREKEIADRKEKPRDVEPPRPLDPEYYITSYRYAYPEDAVFYNAFFAGKLMYYMDELAGILGTRYSRGAVVTAAVDATNFYVPIRVGNAIEMMAAITYIGRSSMEVTIKVIARDDIKGERLHTTTSYFTIVAVDENGRPRRIPPFKPKERWQEELFLKALKRRKLREKLLKELKEKGTEFAPLKKLHELQGYSSSPS